MTILMVLWMFFGAAPLQRVETQHPDITKIMRVETAMNHLTVLEFAEPVTLAAAGSTSFKIERRENKVFIEPLEEGASTNLFVWTDSGRWNYELVPAVSVNTMLFAIDHPIVTSSEIHTPVVPPVAPTSTESIAEKLLLFGKPIRYIGKASDTGSGFLITDVYRKDDQLFFRYVVHNRTTRPFVMGQPEVFALQSVHSETSLYTYRYSQIGTEFEKRIRSRSEMKIATVECDVPAEPLPAGETATGIFMLKAAPNAAGNEPAVFRFVFPSPSGPSTSLTLVL